MKAIKTMNEIEFGKFGTYPKDWKRPDPVDFTVHIIYESNEKTPAPIPCSGCRDVILFHEDEIKEHLNKNQWVFVKHANYKQEYGATCFNETIKEFDRLEKQSE
jgi:hypothetical protein